MKIINIYSHDPLNIHFYQLYIFSLALKFILNSMLFEIFENQKEICSYYQWYLKYLIIFVLWNFQNWITQRLKKQVISFYSYQLVLQKLLLSFWHFFELKIIYRIMILLSMTILGWLLIHLNFIFFYFLH